eukprot:12344244-Alexandrium_andersonii.AAC.2
MPPPGIDQAHGLGRPLSRELLRHRFRGRQHRPRALRARAGLLREPDSRQGQRDPLTPGERRSIPSLMNNPSGWPRSAPTLRSSASGRGPSLPRSSCRTSAQASRTSTPGSRTSPRKCSSATSSPSRSASGSRPRESAYEHS